MTLARTVVVAWLAAAGCSGRPADDRAQPAPPPATQRGEATSAATPPATAPPAVVSPPGPGPAGGTGSGGVNGSAARKLPDGFPPDCVAYAALIEKLARCDQLGAARDGFAQAYRDVAAAWPTVPADQRAQVEAQCRTQADSLQSAAAATCGW